MLNRNTRWKTPYQWPTAAAGATTDYGIVIPALATDPVSTASLAIAPNGEGEMTCPRIGFADGPAGAGTVFTARLGGGVPGRPYVIQITIQCLSGRVLDLLVGLFVDDTLAACPIPLPDSTDFGPVTVYVAPVAPNILTFGGVPLTFAGDFLTFPYPLPLSVSPLDALSFGGQSFTIDGDYLTFPSPPQLPAPSGPPVVTGITNLQGATALPNPNYLISI